MAFDYTDVIYVKDWGTAWNLPFHHRGRITLSYKTIYAWLISHKPLQCIISKLNHKNNRNYTALHAVVFKQDCAVSKKATLLLLLFLATKILSHAKFHRLA